MRVALAVALVPALAAPARAQREPEPQRHEVDIGIDVNVESGGSAALLDAQYTFTPAGIDRRDVVPAVVRRFERHPSSFWARAVHNGGTREAVTGARLGGILNLLDLYLEVEAGLERDLTLFDAPSEHGREYGYFAARVHAGAGLRPSDLVSVGAFYDGRPVIGTDTDDNTPIDLQSERSGGEHTFGVTTTFATPGERLYATVDGYGYRADWSFSRVDAGATTVRGLGGGLRLAYLVTFWSTLQLRAQVRRDHWVDARTGDSDPSIVGASLDRQVITVLGALDYIYFHQSRYGFRISLGGGFEGAPPLYATRDRGVFSLGLGTMLRF